jgi:hypothetical protein
MTKDHGAGEIRGLAVGTYAGIEFVTSHRAGQQQFGEMVVNIGGRDGGLA